MLILSGRHDIQNVDKPYHMKKIFFLAAILLFTSSLFAQILIEESPFNHLKPPEKSVLRMLSSKSVSSNKYIAWRFVSPFATYSVTTQQIGTGIGYGWNRMHFVDSTQSYYTDISVILVLCINGNITPTPYNFTSIGLGFGVHNNLFMLVPAYVVPFGGKKGGIDIKASFGFKF